MKAERDEDERITFRAKPERRLAYEIAIGIVIGGCVLSVIQVIAGAMTVGLMFNGIKIN